MSRVGKYPITVPAGVTADVKDKEILVKGKLGELKYSFGDEAEVSVVDGKIKVAPKGETKKNVTFWGTVRSRINAMVQGVSEGFVKKLEINGVGYKAAMQGKDLKLNLGFSHDVVYQIPEGITVACPSQVSVEIRGIDKQKVGQVAAEIRAFRKPEPYKGKGIKYEGETIIRKQGKKK